MGRDVCEPFPEVEEDFRGRGERSSSQHGRFGRRDKDRVPWRMDVPSFKSRPRNSPSSSAVEARLDGWDSRGRPDPFPFQRSFRKGRLPDQALHHSRSTRIRTFPPDFRRFEPSASRPHARRGIYLNSRETSSAGEDPGDVGGGVR